MLVSERGTAADCATARAPAIPADVPPILIARADLSRTPPARHTPCESGIRAARRGRRGVMYDTVLATGRLGCRRRAVARRSPLRRRAVARRSERRALARPGAYRRLAGGAGRPRVLDVQAGGGRRVTVLTGRGSSVPALRWPSREGDPCDRCRARAAQARPPVRQGLSAP